MARQLRLHAAVELGEVRHHVGHQEDHQQITRTISTDGYISETITFLRTASASFW